MRALRGGLGPVLKWWRRCPGGPANRDRVDVDVAGYRITLDRIFTYDEPHEVTVVLPRVEVRETCTDARGCSRSKEVVLSSITMVHSPVRPPIGEAGGSKAPRAGRDGPNHPNHGEEGNRAGLAKIGLEAKSEPAKRRAGRQGPGVSVTAPGSVGRRDLPQMPQQDGGRAAQLPQETQVDLPGVRMREDAGPQGPKKRPAQP